MRSFDLLNKTELEIDHIVLDAVNLTDLAAVVARTLGVAEKDILVVDCRGHTLVLDVLDTCVNAHKLVGKKERLLENLGGVPGVTVSEKTAFRSRGMLGWIALDEAWAREGLRRSQEMMTDIVGAIKKRVMVFPTGTELIDGQIRDTNTPAIKDYLEAKGYRVTAGPVLPDDALRLSAALRDAVDAGGYGVVITTGGVGAEDKDHTVEAMSVLDPRAATSYICHFEVGTGRHVKDGVKIAVAEYSGAQMIALLGPNDEVTAALEPLIAGLAKGADRHCLAEMIAARLRGILREKMRHHGHGSTKKRILL